MLLLAAVGYYDFYFFLEGLIKQVYIYTSLFTESGLWACLVLAGFLASVFLSFGILALIRFFKKRKKEN